MERVYADSVELVRDSIALTHQSAEIALFGEESTLCSDIIPQVAHSCSNGCVENLVASPIYVICVLLFLLLYMVWLPHVIKSGSVKWSLLKRHHRAQGDSERQLISKQQLGMSIATWILGIALFAILVTRVVAQFSPQSMLFESVQWIGGGVAAIVALIIFDLFVLKSVGYLILDMDFANKIFSLKRQLLFFSVIFLSPPFIISSLCNYQQGVWFVQLSVYLTITLTAIFIYQSFLLFMRQNFSILHWFLYLCGVEILPLTFIWAITTRYLEGAG